MIDTGWGVGYKPSPEQEPFGPRFQQRFKGGLYVSSIRDRVIDIVCEQMGANREKVAEETSFINDLGADSLDTVELVMEFEDEFDLNIPDEDAEKIQTVGDAVKYIEEHA